MALPVSFRWDEGFVARLDAARGLVPRSAFVRWAVERALSEAKGPGLSEQADPGSVPSLEGAWSAAPAEQSEDFEIGEPNNPGGIDYERFTDRVKPSREFRPYPKGGKR